jgi:hypothetical protein
LVSGGCYLRRPQITVPGKELWSNEKANAKTETYFEGKDKLFYKKGV